VRFSRPAMTSVLVGLSAGSRGHCVRRCIEPQAHAARACSAVQLAKQQKVVCCQRGVRAGGQPAASYQLSAGNECGAWAS
jgi:hypothetical protein